MKLPRKLKKEAKKRLKEDNIYFIEYKNIIYDMIRINNIFKYSLSFSLALFQREGRHYINRFFNYSFSKQYETPKKIKKTN